jgi:hypothetical protein
MEKGLDREITARIVERLWRLVAHGTAERVERVLGERARVESRLLRIRVAG